MAKFDSLTDVLGVGTETGPDGLSYGFQSFEAIGPEACVNPQAFGVEVVHTDEDWDHSIFLGDSEGQVRAPHEIWSWSLNDPVMVPWAQLSWTSMTSQ